MSEQFIQLQTFKYPFLFIGNEHPIKGIDILCDLLSLTFRDYDFAIVGDLPKLQEIYKGCKKIHFQGILKGEKKKSIIKQSMLLILPSYHESFSMVICEALSLKCPVICFDMPTLRSIYKTGVCFVPYGNTQIMWQEMKKLIHNPLEYYYLRENINYNWTWEESARKVLE